MLALIVLGVIAALLVGVAATAVIVSLMWAVFSLTADAMARLFNRLGIDL